jgi:ATP-binding cassette, subfamily B, bacterial PglK
MKKINYLVGTYKVKFYFIVFLFLVSSLLEFFSLSLMVPFMNFILDIGSTQNYIFDDLIKYFKIDKEVLLYLLILTFFFRYLIILYVNYKIPDIAFDHQKKLRFKILRNYIHSNKLDYSSSDLIQLSTATLSIFTVQFLTTVMKLISSAIIITFILIFLIFFNPQGTLAMFALLFVFFLFYKIYFKNKFKTLGDNIIKNNKNVIDLTNEVFKGLQEIRIYNKSNFFLKRIQEFSSVLSRSETFLRFFVPLPRVMLEMLIVFGFLLVVVIYLNLNSSIPVVLILIYGYAALRILPHISEFITSINVSRSAKKTVDDLYAYLKNTDRNINKSKNKKINFETLDIKNISFKYPNSNNFLFKNLSLQIRKGDTVAIFGESGIGKSTLVKLILGVEKYTSGSIKINKKINNENMQAISSYIPQENFIFKGNIRQNILLDDISNKDIDKKIWKSLKKVRISEKIQSLPNKLSSILNENGSNLSGGQRQRISLARAFFHDRKVIFLDESTSSLDSTNEESILKYLKKDKDLTKIIITHKQKLINYCNLQIIFNKKNIKVIRK